MKDSLFTAFRRWRNHHFQSWADRRTPAATRIQLNLHRIYIVPTGSGFFWLAMVLVIFLVAVNYSNSLAYGLCFFMLSLFLLSIIHTWRNLAGITLVAKRAEAGFAGELIPVSVECLNERRPRYSIAVGWPETESVVVSFESDRDQGLVAQTGSRGWFRPGRLRVESIYPLGLCRAWSWVRLDFHSLVYPAPDDRYPLPESETVDEGERSLTASGFEEFAGFRSYQQTDTPAHVFWKGYARTGELLTKQFDQPSGSELWLSPDLVPEGDLEQRLSVLTAWCLQCDRQQYAYGLVLAEQKLAPSTGELHLQQCLEMLALYKLDEGTSGGING